MRRSRRAALLLALSILLIAVGVFGIAFLCVWYFELVLWGIFAPLALGSFYLGVRIWRPSAAAERAVSFWAISVAWTVSFVLLSFNDVTRLGALVMVAAAAGAICVVYLSVKKSIASA
jgi:FtsH-binding integral membrane protein